MIKKAIRIIWQLKIGLNFFRILAAITSIFSSSVISRQGRRKTACSHHADALPRTKTASGCPNRRMSTCSTKRNSNRTPTEAGSASRSIPSIGTSASTADPCRIGRLHKTRRSKRRDGWSALICVLLRGRALKTACRKSISVRTASALERKGVSSERGNENRKIISVNKVLASLQKTVREIGELRPGRTAQGGQPPTDHRKPG